MNGEPVIDVHGLTKSFNGKVVVDHVDLSVRRGEIVGFLGPNGSGKTTTIRMMCGLLLPDEGEGTCLGFDIVRESAKIKARVGYMTQRFSLYGDLTVTENLAFMGRLHSVKDVHAAVARALDEYDFRPRAHQLAAELSGGDGRRPDRARSPRGTRRARRVGGRACRARAAPRSAGAAR